MKRLRHPIRAIREPFGTAGLIIACVALIAALGGTAIAAKGGLTGKQKKEVEKIAKKYSGKRGPRGQNGQNGSNGEPGAKGDTGAPGSNGTSGTNGSNGKSVSVTNIAAGGSKCEGRAGAEVKQEGAASGTPVCDGKDGTTGFTSTLPTGEQETGIWSYYQAPVEGLSAVSVPITFSIPISTEVEAFYFSREDIEVAEENEVELGHGCKWNTEEFSNANARPEATVAGTLCVFASEESFLGNLQSLTIQNPTDPLAVLTSKNVAGPAGAYLVFQKKTTTEPKALSARGAWAVSAP